MRNCEKIPFYSFCTGKISDNCYYYLYRKLIEVDDSVKSTLQKQVKEWLNFINNINEKNYMFVVDKINLEETKKNQKNENVVFYFYKVYIKNKLNITITRKTSFEEVYSYLYLIKNSSKDKALS